MAYCGRCGKYVREGDSFCPHCGTPMSRTTTTYASAPAPRYNAGDKLTKAALTLAIIAIGISFLALIPGVGIVIAVIVGFLVLLSVALGIPGIIKAAGKGKGIAAFIIDVHAIVFAICFAVASTNGTIS